MKDELFESLLSKKYSRIVRLSRRILLPEKARVVYRLFHGVLLHHPHTLLRGLPFFRFTLFRLQPP